MKAANDPEVSALFHEHLELVERLASKVARSVGSGLDRDELRSFGREGLLDAARRFDAERGVPFGAYATLRIRGSMFDGIRQLSALPRRAYERVRAFEAAQLVSEGAAEDVFGGPRAGPVEADAALASHLATMATAFATSAVSGVSADAAAPDANPEEAIAELELRGILRAAIAELPEPERQLLERHYFHGERFDHVARELGLSKSWASRLHTRAVRQLTARLGTPPLKGPHFRAHP